MELTYEVEKIENEYKEIIEQVRGCFTNCWAQADCSSDPNPDGSCY